MRRFIATCLVLTTTLSLVNAAEGFPPIPRKLPPQGKELPADEAKRLRSACDKLGVIVSKLSSSPHAAVIAIFHKALDLALHFDEFYEKKDVGKGEWCLQQAKERLSSLQQAPWTQQRGAVVHGFYSAIDLSPQPYGLMIPDKLDLSKPVHLYVWLHGRGDKDTDIHLMQ